MHIVMREGGWPTLEVAVAQARPNTQEAIDVVARATSTPPPAPAAAPAAPPQPVKLADGVWQLTPNGEGSILVEFKDYVVMVEAPGGDAVTAASIAAAQRLTPGKPIKYVDQHASPCGPCGRHACVRGRGHSRSSRTSRTRNTTRSRSSRTRTRSIPIVSRGCRARR